MGFSRQKYWSGLPFLSPGDLPDPGVELTSPPLQADSLPIEPPGKPKGDKGRIKYLGMNLHEEVKGFPGGSDGKRICL